MPETSVQPPKKTSAPIEVTYLPPRRTWWHRLMDDLRSWSRHTFSRDSYVSSLKSLLWVVPLTVLIWIYAEQEKLTEVDNVVVHLQPPGNKIDRVVRFAFDSTVGESPITADLKGPQERVEEVKQWLSTTVIPLEVDAAFPEGRHEIPLQAQLNSLPKMKDKGVTVTRASDIPVFIELVKEVEVDVVADPSPETSELQPPVFEPSKVKIRAPVSDIDKAQKAGRLVAYASFKQFTSALQEPGAHDLTLVPLFAPQSMNPTTVRFSPPAVSARIQVPQKVQSTAVIRNAVIFMGYPNVLNATQVVAKYDKFIDVQVTGPEATVAALQGGNPPVVAFFQVDISNPENRNPRQAELTFKLPEGVRVSDPDPQHKTVTYTLEPRTSGGGE